MYREHRASYGNTMWVESGRVRVGARPAVLRVPAPSKSTQHSTPRPAGAALLRTPGNLTAVSMATENKIDICAGGASQNDWVMRQQQLHFVISRAGQSQRQIFQSNHGVIDAGQP